MVGENFKFKSSETHQKEGPTHNLKMDEFSLHFDESLLLPSLQSESNSMQRRNLRKIGAQNPYFGYGLTGPRLRRSLGQSDPH